MTGTLARLVLTVALVAAACSSPAPTSTTAAPDSAAAPAIEPPAGPVPLIVDYSPTVSDVGALLYLLSHPNVDVLAITLPVTGEAGCELGAEVTLGILAMFDRRDIPVACDPELPSGAKEWPPEFLTGHEALTFGLPDPVTDVDSRPANRLIADIVAASERPVTIYAVAPLTNLARALEVHPEVRDGIDRVVIMGGAVEAAGNVQNTDAEWNLWIDAPSAASVFASGVPITLVPLDATNDVPVPVLWQSDLEAAEQNDAVGYLTALVRIFPAVTSGLFYLWDELAGAVAAGEDLITADEYSVLVVDDGSIIREPAGTLVIVATGVGDPAGFYAHFLATISGGAVEQAATLEFDETTAPIAVGASSSPEEVLAYWLFRSLDADVEAAASVVAPGAPWVGVGPTPDDYVAGSQPYQVFDIKLACTSAGAVALCDVTFRDLWIDGIPELERGALSIEAEVADGRITAFRALAYDAGTFAAFDAHRAWLQAHQQAVFIEACAANPFGHECSELFVATVDGWVASR